MHVNFGIDDEVVRPSVRDSEPWRSQSCCAQRKKVLRSRKSTMGVYLVMQISYTVISCGYFTVEYESLSCESE